MKNGQTAKPFSISIPKILTLGVLLALAAIGIRGRQQATADAKLAVATEAKEKQKSQTDQQQSELVTVAARHSSRAKQLLGQSSLEDALAEYTAAIKIQTQLVQHSPDGLAMSYINRGIAHRARTDTQAAIEDFSNGIRLFRQLVDQGNTPSVARLAASHRLRAAVYRDQNNAALAIADFGHAIALQTDRITAEGSSKDLEMELAKIHTDRGYLAYSQGDQAAASRDFDSAIAIRSRLVENGHDDVAPELAVSHNNRGISRRALGDLDAAIADFGKAIEIRTKLPTRNASAVNDLAGTYNNRGNALLALKEVQSAVQDYERAIEIRTPFSESDATKQPLELVKSLCTLAWIYATYPDDQIRSASKAMQYANRACELSDWKYHLPLQTLAAANANAGNFSDATKWQEEAVRLAPANEADKLRVGLELYQAGKPYRETASTE